MAIRYTAIVTNLRLKDGQRTNYWRMGTRGNMWPSHVTSDRVWQRALASVSEAASLAATLGTSLISLPIQTSCVYKDLLSQREDAFDLRRYLPVNSSPVKTNEFYS